MKSRILLFLTLIISTHLSAQQWEQLNDPPFLVDHSNGFGIDGKAYILQGAPYENYNTIYSDDFWEYNPEGDTWTQLDDFPGSARAIAIGDSWDGKYYYGFGRGAGGAYGTYLNDIWVFDPADMSFTELASCPCTPRAHPGFVAHNDKIFMGAGSSNNGDLDDWWIYDMLTDTWNQGPDIPDDIRHHPFQFGIDDYVYIGGGHVDSWYKWDIINESWSGMDSEPDGRVAGSQFAYNGRGYVIGGDDRFHDDLPDSQSFMEYEPETDDWTNLEALPNGSRWANSSFVIGSNVYFFDGFSNFDNPDPTMWTFDMSIINPVDSSLIDTTVVVVDTTMTDTTVVVVDTTMTDSTSTFINTMDVEMISVHPNPFSEFIYITLPSAIEPYEIEIIDSKGAAVFRKESHTHGEALNVEHLKLPGIYIIYISDGSSRYMQKLVKH